MSITIKKLLDVDEDIFINQSNITLDATVKQVGQVNERKVKSGSRAGEPFWSQKLTIQDSTGAIVVDYIANKAEEAIPKTAIGLKVRVEGAKTDIYKDERRLARGKVTLLESAKPPQGGTGESSSIKDGYYVVVGPNGKIVLNPVVDVQKRAQLLREGIAKSFIEATQKWNKTIEKQAQEAHLWVVGKDFRKEATDIIVKPLIEAGQKWSEAEKKEKSEENKIEKREAIGQFNQLNDPNFNRADLIKQLGKRFGTLFVAGKTKGLNLEEWLTKNYEVKSFMGLSDDYLVELDTVFNDMEKGE